MSKRKCWARDLGGCSDAISGEHIVTAGLFETDVVAVQGFGWCRDEPKHVGLSSLTRNILCTKHNSTLSTVDSAAIAAFDVFRECVRLTDVRQSMAPRRWNISHLKIDGLALERWFLKTLINVAIDGEQRIGPLSTLPGEPSQDLVRIGYGLAAFTGKAGLYAAAQVGETVTNEDRVNITSFLDASNERVLGGTFYFRGWRFVLYLDSCGLSPTVNVVHKDGHFEKMPPPIYHPRQIKFTVGGGISHVVDFDWRLHLKT
jgi:hypothetical protein